METRPDLGNEVFPPDDKANKMNMSAQDADGNPIYSQDQW